MLENLSKKFSNIFQRLRHKGVLSEDDVNVAIRELRISLLEADVALPALKSFIEDVKSQSVGQTIWKSLSPTDMVIKIVHDSLMRLLDHPQNALHPKPKKGPLVILMVGLQGSGKTTFCGKLAWLLTKNIDLLSPGTEKNQKILLASLDVYRPAAQIQLESLGKSVQNNEGSRSPAFSAANEKQALEPHHQVQTLPIIPEQKPLAIVERAQTYAKQHEIDILIFDTAGRTELDQAMMQELANVYAATQPHEILFTVDAGSGQMILQTAQSFQKVVPITGFALSRMDADSRAGAALSLRHVTGLPIKFLGTGEHPQDIQAFQAQRLADRILDRGDVLALVEKAALATQGQDQEKFMQRLQKGIFTLDDWRQQLTMFQGIGVNTFLDHLPGMTGLKDQLEKSNKADALDPSHTQKKLRQQLAILSSMTAKERRQPQLLNGSRKQRIAQGSGTTVTDIHRMMTQYEQMRTMMKQMTQGPMGRMMARFFSKK